MNFRTHEPHPIDSDPQEPRAVKVGALVNVLPKIVTGEADEWTGKLFRVVAVRPPNRFGGCASAALAPWDLVNPDASDEVVDVAIARLEVVS